jgi:hypothetical protein
LTNKAPIAAAIRKNEPTSQILNLLTNAKFEPGGRR